MNSTMKFISVWTMALLLQSCGWRVLQVEEKEKYEASKLYDPPTVHLIPGMLYQFKEGQLMGRDQKFHSDASYRDAVILTR